MITLRRLTKYHGKNTMRRLVMDDVCGQFLPGRNYVVFGGRHSGKSTLLRLLCGLQTPSRGRVERRGTVSIPVGSASQVAPMKSAGELIHFLGTLYGAEPRSIHDFVMKFSGVTERLMQIPISDLPPQMRIQINYAIGYGIPSDFVLFDDYVTSLEPSVKEMGKAAFEQRRRTCGTIVTARSANAKALGDHGVVIHQGKLYFFENVEEAAETFAFIEQEKTLSAVEPGPSYATALVRWGDADGALDHLKTHVDANPGHLPSLQMIAELSLARGDLTSATTISQQILEQEPRSMRSICLLGKIAFDEGRFDEASYLSLAGLQVEPGNKDCGMRLARCYEALNEFGRAGDVWVGLSRQFDNAPFLRFALRDYVRANSWSAVLEIVDEALDRVSVRELALLEYKLRALLEVKLLSEARIFISECTDVEAEIVFRQLKRLALTDDWIYFDELISALPSFCEGRHDGSATLSSLLALVARKKKLAAS